MTRRRNSSFGRTGASQRNSSMPGEARDHRNGRQLSCAVLDTASEEVQLIDFPDPRAA